MLNELTDDSDPHPDLFDAAVEVLQALTIGQGPVAGNVLRFELSTLRLLGHLPSLDACAECGTAIEAQGRIAFGQLSGGVLCARCRPGKKQVVSMSRAALRMLQAYASPSPQIEELDRGVLGEVRGVLNQYLSHLLGHRPRMHGYLGILAG